MKLEGLKINFLGDSITEGHGVSDPSKRFTDLIAARTGAVCRNYGIGGTRIARQHTPSEKARWDLDFNSRVAEMDPDADIVVVFGGTNDFGHGDAPIGTFDDRTEDTFYGAVHCLCEKLFNKYPKSQLVFMTPMHRKCELLKTGSEERTVEYGTLKEYVEIIREVTEYYGIPLLDLFRTSGIQPAIPKMRELYMPDSLHPNDAGHELLAHMITRFLENLM